MNKAHDVAPISQEQSLEADVLIVLRATVVRITTSNLWIYTRSVWPPMSDRPIQSPAQARFDAGISYYECGEFDKAVAEFQAALQLDWRHEDALTWISIAENAAREHAAATYPSALGLSGLNRRTQVYPAAPALGTE